MSTSTPERIRSSGNQLAQLGDALGLELDTPVAQAPRVVADCEVPVPEGGGRRDHVLERRLPVRPVRVGVEIAEHVGSLDERRQASVPGSVKLASVLAQLRRNPGVAQVGVQLLLALVGRDLAGLDRLDAVLGNREAAAHGVFTQSDVVVLRAGEVLQQVAEALGRNDTEIEP